MVNGGMWLGGLRLCFGFSVDGVLGRWCEAFPVVFEALALFTNRRYIIIILLLYADDTCKNIEE